jgi:MFS family permease
MIPRRLSVTASMVGFTLLGDSMLYAVLPAEAAHLGLSAAAVGWILSLNRWVRLLTNSLAARVTGQLGWKAPFLLAVLVAGLSTAGYAFFHSLWGLLAARMLWGLCWSFLRHGGVQAAIETSTPQTRGRNMGSLSAIFRMGSLVGMVAGGLLTDTIGYRAALWIFAISTVCGLGVALWDGWFADGQWRPKHPGVIPGQHLRLWSALRSPAWVGLALCGLLVHGIASGTVMATLGYHLREKIPAGWVLGSVVIGVATLSGLLQSIRWVTGIGLNPFMGHLSDRLGRQRLITIGAAAGALGLASLAGASQVPLITLSVVLIWLAESAMAPTLDGAAAEQAHRDGAEAMGLYLTGIDLGAAIGPLYAYYLVTLVASFSQVYLINGLLLLGVVILFRTLVQTNPSRVAA